MANVYLDPGVIDDAERRLSQAHQEMIDSIQQTSSGLLAAQDQLSGATNNAWGAFQAETNKQTGSLNEDFGQGIVALDQIRELLLNADSSGAQRFAR